MAEAIFLNREEVPVQPLYYDPGACGLCMIQLRAATVLRLGGMLTLPGAHPASLPTIFAVHDFGFMRFDPRRLAFMEAAEIPLAPHAAQVGLDIRVVGNDSGEKVRGW